MGPGFGAGLVECMVALGIMLLVVGALLGIGCNAGCGYVTRHVRMEWKQ